ncbi:MAG: hypothetical protein ACREQI_14670 [Candidatus Binataceae bacterium]
MPPENNRPPSRRDPTGLTAFAIYLPISALIMGRTLIGHFHDSYIGINNNPFLFKGINADPYGFMWFLAWWPLSITHRINPFFTRLLWHPIGLNLTWTTSIPLPSIILWPVTAACGPIAAYNSLILIAPPLAAWAAFLLCRHASQSWFAALLGGYIFGFSSSILGAELAGAPQISLVFLVPLACLTVAHVIEGAISARRLAISLAAILTAQFLISTEVFATLTMFGAAALFLGWFFAVPGMRRRIAGVLFPIACAYAVSAVVLSPFIYWSFALGWPHGEMWPQAAKLFSAGSLDFLAPSRFPLLVIAIAYIARNWRTPLCKGLAAFLVIATVLSWGPRLHIAGQTYIDLPGKLITSLPLINKALPARFILYSVLCLAIMTTLWISSNRYGRGMNLTIATVLILLLLPDFSTAWTSPVENSPFFTSGIFRKYLRRGENVLVLPFGSRAASMLWQAETGMYFQMAGGYTGPPPPEYTGWPIMFAFTAESYLPDTADQLGAFMRHHRVDAAVVANGDKNAGFWGSLLSQFSAPPAASGGVTVYRILPATLERYRGVTAFQMRQRADSAAIDSLVIGAARWLSAGYDPAQLTATGAVERNFLQADWCAGRPENVVAGERNKAIGLDLTNHWFCGAWLGATHEGHVTVAIYGIYGELEPALTRLRGDASRIYFPYPRNLLAPGAATPPPNARGLMQIVFNREQLIAAAAKLAKGPRP